jgi:TPP-dependent pyruvate/acetoin dehydrogenase alpha subunit
MEEEDGWTDEQMTEMDQEVRQAVDDSYEFAEQSPEPPLEALYEHVLVDTTS